jgi:DNA-binding GntR family transcriptional regulator
MREKLANALSLTESTYFSLHEDILGGILRPGQRLRIIELSTRYAVSIGAIREALSRLSAEGLVSAEPQRGFRVTPISRNDLKSLTIVRCHVEELCLRRAIELGDLSWEGNVVATYHKLSRTPTRVSDADHGVDVQWRAAHAQFHRMVVSACDSAWLLKLREQLYAQSDRYQRLSLSSARPDRDADKEHYGLVEAILDRNADLAVSRMKAHLETTVAIVLRTYDVDEVERAQSE